jgi:hypothetical protein
MGRSVFQEVRRALEESWAFRVIAATVIGLCGLGVAIDREWYVAAALASCTAAALLVVPGLTTDPKRLARLERRATSAPPQADGDATLIGTVVASISPLTPLVGKYSEIPCVAYAGRAWGEDPEAGPVIREEPSATVDFVLRCSDVLVTVETLRAEVLFDPACATFARDYGDGVRVEESAARVGDRVLVSGHYVRGAADGPSGASARITQHRRRRVIVGLIAAR